MYDDKTPRGYPLPHESNTLKQDVGRIREGLGVVDADVAGIERLAVQINEALKRQRFEQFIGFWS
uniref:Uncharacterized protein n=1 Tax=Candidatus Kentrum sp. LFY TaxID=2126342 RepID=A0A450W6Z6_9GAMM|nr:MAG: hypothetical protein BECKLFY1418C_GA0070996_100174 [Candidatus Kentron sp. LFY]